MMLKLPVNILQLVDTPYPMSQSDLYAMMTYNADNEVSEIINSVFKATSFPDISLALGEEMPFFGLSDISLVNANGSITVPLNIGSYIDETSSSFPCRTAYLLYDFNRNELQISYKGSKGLTIIASVNGGCPLFSGDATPTNITADNLVIDARLEAALYTTDSVVRVDWTNAGHAVAHNFMVPVREQESSAFYYLGTMLIPDTRETYYTNYDQFSLYRVLSKIFVSR